MSSKARQETEAWERVNHRILLKHRDVLGAMGDETPKGWRVENILWRGLECWEGARGVKTKCNQQSSTLGGF